MLDGVTWFKQSAFRWQADGHTIYVDPWELPDDQPPADVLLLTHAHFDHYSPGDIGRLSVEGTTIVAPHDVAAELTGDVIAVEPGDRIDAGGITVEAVPAYNVVESRLDAHPKGRGWVGYLLEIDGRTWYHAGDTDHLPELDSLRPAVAMLPIGGTFTMDPGEAATFAKVLQPHAAIPMHYGGYVDGVGCASDAEWFRDAAAPIRVETLEPKAPLAA